MKKNRLILGDGLLGSELHKQTGWDYISRKKDGIDFSDIKTYEHMLDDYDEIINCIASTNTYDENKENHWNVNYKGVVDLVDRISVNNQKLVHISTDYVYSYSKPFANENDVPVHCRNWYSYTKLLADAYIELRSKRFIIIRSSFIGRISYEYGWMQFGNFDFVDVIGDIMINLIKKNVNGIYNVGTELKTKYDLFSKYNKDVKPIFDFQYESAPENVTMDISKLKRIIK